MGNPYQKVWFWQIVRELDPAQRSALLHFVTGSACAPATGFANLMGYAEQMHRFELQLIVGSSDRLPTAATCFNTLKMVVYSDIDQMRTRLLAALAGSEGFDEAAVAT